MKVYNLYYCKILTNFRLIFYHDIRVQKRNQECYHCCKLNDQHNVYIDIK
jgi:hypothetical protein